ncbi:hypothetical protein [Parabacteroides pacaensis]|uniref:hypothetical protein n=1 Tax=Parabacteroides pacaensis TaxID=2086575 RepID=UPI00131E715B|nr:hypothetical protein [Parabacteroides pacaensis]
MIPQFIQHLLFIIENFPMNGQTEKEKYEMLQKYLHGLGGEDMSEKDLADFIVEYHLESRFKALQVILLSDNYVYLIYYSNGVVYFNRNNFMESGHFKLDSWLTKIKINAFTTYFSLSMWVRRFFGGKSK